MILHCGEYDLEVLEDDKSYRYRAIRMEEELTLYFSMPGFTEVPVGAYCEYQGQVYTLKSEENFKKNGTRNFEYTLVLHTGQADLRKWKIRHPVTKKLKFSLVATPAEHLNLLIENLNMRDSGWLAGDCIGATQKIISYNHVFCSDALDMIADEFETEWEFEGKIIHLRKAEHNKDNPLPLSYGKGNGFLPGVGRSNYEDARKVEILYTQGGERNIDVSKYGSPELLLPKSRTLAYEGRIYETDEYGLSIRRKDVPPVTGNEDSLDCPHIYPMRNGAVSGVNVVDAGEHLYDIIDSSIPADLNFEDCMIVGETMTVMFQTGILTGKEFEAKYIHSERRFELVPFEFEGEKYPNAGWAPVVGDTYAVYGIMLPKAYVCDDDTQSGASWDMFREGARYLHEHEEQPFTFSGELDGIWSKQDWINIGGKIVLGGYVSFTDSQFQQTPALIRIVGIKDFIRRPYSPVLELSNRVISGTVVNELQKIDSNEVVVDDLRRDSNIWLKRRWRDAIETLTIMQEVALAGFETNFTEAIAPLTIQSMMALFGDASLQFRFVDSMTNPHTVAYHVIFSNSTKILTAPAVIIQHETLGIDDVAPSHSDDEYKFWQLQAFNSPPLEDAKKYYLYAKVSRSSTGGVFYLSETAISMNDDPDYYYLWVGFLNSAFGGQRTNFVHVNGFTEILPGQITTNRIRDALGRLVTDYENAKIIARNGAEIIGKITFESGSSGLENVEEWQQFTEIQNYVDNVLQNTLDRLQNQIDDAIESWFYHYDPTLSNVPASDWTTAGLKEAHLDDTFTNLDSGQSWRFTKDAGDVYAWTLMADTAASKALVLAGQAQDTADGKRRVFVNTPYTPYDVGDLWVQGASGDIMRCQTARRTGGYVASDWVKASKYTDDSAALAAIDNAVSNLNDYLDGAFSDGIVSESEAASIELYLNILATEKANIDSGYGILYSHSLLTGTAKSNLSSAKATLDTRYSNLVNTINSAISDGKITASEKAGVDSYYTLYKNALSAYSTRYEEAHAFIETSINNNISTGTTAAKEDMAKRLGYNSYSDLVAAAVAGKTVIDGNYIRTALIDAEAIVTKELIAQRLTAAMIEALDITTNKLTVTSGAKIGNFTINSGWLLANSNSQGDGFISLRGAGTDVSFGHDLMPSTDGGRWTLTGSIENNNTSNNGGRTVALYLKAAGRSDSGGTLSEPIALDARGGVLMKGCYSCVKKIYGPNLFTSANDASALASYDTFVFQLSESKSAYLPSRAAIETVFGSFNEGYGVGYLGYIKITILVSRWATAYVQIRAGDSGTPLLDNNGNVMQYREMGAGDVLEVAYYNGAWYTVNWHN